MSMSNWYSKTICLDEEQYRKIIADLKIEYAPDKIPLMAFYNATKHLFKTIARYSDCNTIDEPRAVFGA